MSAALGTNEFALVFGPTSEPRSRPRFIFRVDYNGDNDMHLRLRLDSPSSLYLSPEAATAIARRLLALSEWSTHPLYKWGQKKIGRGGRA